MEDQLEKVSNLLSGTQNHVDKISDIKWGASNLIDTIQSNTGTRDSKDQKALELSDDTETLDMEDAFVIMEGRQENKSICTYNDMNPTAGPNMSQISQLENLYNKRVKVDDSEQKRYLSLMKTLVGAIIAKMKEKSKTFNALYREPYYGGSVFDGLKVNSTGQEFDLNILFKWKAKDLEVVRLGQDSKKKNFGFLKATKKDLTLCEDKILDTDDYGLEPGSKYLSPIKMFNLLKSSVDKVLTYEAQTISHKGHCIE